MLKTGYVDLYHKMGVDGVSLDIHVRANYKAGRRGKSVSLELNYDVLDIVHYEGTEREQAERAVQITPELEEIFWRQAVSRLFGREATGDYAGSGNLRKIVAMGRALVPAFNRKRSASS